MRTVHPSEVGAVDLGTMLRDQAAAQAQRTAASAPCDLEVNGDGFAIYVTQLDTADGGGYISAHRTQSGGIAKLIDFAARIGIDVDDYHAGTGTSDALDDAPGVTSYAVMRLPLED